MLDGTRSRCFFALGFYLFRQTAAGVLPVLQGFLQGDGIGALWLGLESLPLIGGLVPTKHCTKSGNYLPSKTLSVFHVPSVTFAWLRWLGSAVSRVDLISFLCFSAMMALHEISALAGR